MKHQTVIQAPVGGLKQQGPCKLKVGGVPLPSPGSAAYGLCECVNCVRMVSREAYRRQTSVMCRLKHANVTALLGVCAPDEPPSAVLEYARCGDLATFLRSSRATDDGVDATSRDGRNARPAFR